MIQKDSQQLSNLFHNLVLAISDKIIENLNIGARVLICGQISQYNNKEPELGPRNYWQFLA